MKNFEYWNGLLKVRHLKETGVLIQLADRFIVHLEGVLEDVFVR